MKVIEAHLTSFLRVAGCCFFIIACSLTSVETNAQNYFAQWWFTYNNQTRLSEKWGYTFDLNYRTSGVFPFNSSLVAARAGANFHPNSTTRISGGYAWFGTFVSREETLWLPEHRLWQQIQWNKNSNGTLTAHRIRLEERFRTEFASALTDQTIYAYTTRLRYLFQVQRRFSQSAKETGIRVSWQATNEIMFHTGDAITQRKFDQNRTLVGTVFSFSRTTELALLYQFIVQLVPQTQERRYINSIRITLLHNIDKR